MIAWASTGHLYTLIEPFLRDRRVVRHHFSAAVGPIEPGPSAAGRDRQARCSYISMRDTRRSQAVPTDPDEVRLRAPHPPCAGRVLTNSGKVLAPAPYGPPGWSPNVTTEAAGAAMPTVGNVVAGHDVQTVGRWVRLSCTALRRRVRGAVPAADRPHGPRRRRQPTDSLAERSLTTARSGSGPWTTSRPGAPVATTASTGPTPVPPARRWPLSSTRALWPELADALATAERDGDPAGLFRLLDLTLAAQGEGEERQDRAIRSPRTTQGPTSWP